MNSQTGFDIFRDFFQIFDVVFWNQYMLDPATQSSQQFFLQTANRQDFATQSDFAGHRHVCTHRNFGKGRNHRQSHGDTCTRTVFRRRTFRYMDVNVFLLVKIRSQTH